MSYKSLRSFRRAIKEAQTEYEFIVSRLLVHGKTVVECYACDNAFTVTDHFPGREWRCPCGARGLIVRTKL